MEQPPQETRPHRLARILGQAAIGSVPVAGPGLATVFTEAVTWHLSKRYVAWLETLTDIVTRLQEAPSVDDWVNDWMKDPEFVDVLW